METKCKYKGWPACKEGLLDEEECPVDCYQFEQETIRYEAFSVIYSVDLFNDRDRFSRFCPKNFHVWSKTEDNREKYDIDLYSRHRKYVGFLSEKQFKQFLDMDLVFASSTRTMGSLGAPGLGYGLSPAMLFDNHENDILLSAYVTPIPVVSETPLFPDLPMGGNAWDVVERDIWDRCDL